MKTKLLLLAALSLLFLACQEDGDDFLPEELNKNVNRGPKPGGNDNGVALISFLATSIKNGIFYTADNCLPEGRNLLLEGNLSGKLAGYGKINASLSTFTFISCEELPINPPNVSEPLMYALVAEGTLALGTRDQCRITITGNLYPYLDPQTGIDGGTFIGTATTHDGKGKLSGFDRVFEVYGNGPPSGGFNLTSGEFRLRISDPMP